MIDVRKYKKFTLDPQKDPQLSFIYSIYDRAAGFFNPPVSSMLVPEQQLQELRRSAMNGSFQYPNDLELYLISIFDTASGRVVESNTFLVGNLSIGDFARNGNVPNTSQTAQG